MDKIAYRKWLLMTIVFAVCIITCTLPGIMIHPWHQGPDLWGDGGKNTFAYLYHILYDKGSWFTGMNYPYGEHIIYTDGQPLLSVTLGHFNGITIAQSLIVMWWLLGMSYILSVVYLWKILVHFGVKPFLAMIFAGLIAMLSPQIFGLQGHFGLAYGCIVPMLFYWGVKYNATPHWKFPVYIFLLGSVAVFLHPYFSALLLIWVSFYAVGYFIFIKAPSGNKIRHVAPLVVSIVLLFTFITIVIKITDPIKDRPANPYGMLEYCTTGEQIFTSYHSLIWKYVKDKVPAVAVSEGGEGCCYPGVIVLAIVVFSIAGRIRNWRKKKQKPGLADVTAFSPIWPFIAFASLLFSMGVPFLWHMEWLLKYATAFRQFRTLDRFSWIFYYMITVYGVVILSSWYSKKLSENKKALAYTVMTAALVIWGIEAGGYIVYERENLSDGRDNYAALLGKKNNDWTGFLSGHQYGANNFQALLVLGFCEIGTDKLWLGKEKDLWGMYKGFIAGLQLHLPIVDAMMARSSWSEIEKQVKIAAGPYVHKPILDDIKSDKPFLLLYRSEDPPDPDQGYLIAASDFIGHFDECDVFACYPARIRANDKMKADSICAILPSIRDGDTCVKYTGPWYVNHFDTGKAGNILFGGGALPEIKQFETAVAQIPLKPVYDKQVYEFSCWFLLGSEDYSSPYFKLDILDGMGNVISTTDVLTKESTDNHGLWFRAQAFVSIPANCTVVKCRLFNEPDNTYKVMDELMLRPADAVIISKAKGRTMVNNHLF
jgi:hypothetical protein